MEFDDYNTSSNLLCENLLPHDKRNSCSLGNDEYGRLDAIAMVRMMSSLLGLLGACSIILSAVIRKKVFNPDIHPIFMLSLADCGLAVLWIIGSSLWLSNLSDNRFRRVYCYPVTLLTGILECVALNLTLVYAVLAYFRTKRTDLHTLMASSYVLNRSGVSKKTVLVMYLIAWLLPALAILLLLTIIASSVNYLSSTQACTCWCRPTVINVVPFALSSDKDSSIFMRRQLILSLSVGGFISLQYLIVFFFLIFLYLKILAKIKKLKQENESRQMAYNYGTTAKIEQGQSRATKRVLLFLTVFIFSGFFNLCCTTLVLPLIANALDNPNPSNVSDKLKNIYFSFVFAQSLTLPLQGFLNALVYGWTRDDFISTISLPLRASDLSPAHDNHFDDTEVEDSDYSISSSLVSQESSQHNFLSGADVDIQ